MEEQKKRRFNVLDVLILLVIAAGICFLAFRLTALDRPEVETPEEDYVITFAGDAVANYVLDHVQVGDAVTNDGLNCDLGTVVDIRLAPSMYYDKDDAGNWINASRPDYQSLRMMCCVKGLEKEGSFTVDGASLLEGGYLVVRAGDAKMYLSLYDVQKLSDTPYSLPEAGQ